jgi:hypothetical protein
VFGGHKGYTGSGRMSLLPILVARTTDICLLVVEITSGREREGLQVFICCFSNGYPISIAIYAFSCSSLSELSSLRPALPFYRLRGKVITYSFS